MLIVNYNAIERTIWMKKKKNKNKGQVLTENKKPGTIKQQVYANQSKAFYIIQAALKPIIPIVWLAAFTMILTGLVPHLAETTDMGLFKDWNNMFLQKIGKYTLASILNNALQFIIVGYFAALMVAVVLKKVSTKK